MRWITKSRFRRAHRQKFRSVHFCLFQEHRPQADIARQLGIGRGHQKKRPIRFFGMIVHAPRRIDGRESCCLRIAQRAVLLFELVGRSSRGADFRKPCSGFLYIGLCPWTCRSCRLQDSYKLRLQLNHLYDLFWKLRETHQVYRERRKMRSPILPHW
jgi:hypothetical protein